MTELLPYVAQHPLILWLVVTVGGLTWAAKWAAEASESVRSLLGPIGRWMSARMEQAERRRSAEAADIADLRRQVGHLAERLDAVVQRSERQAEYLAYDAAWHADTGVWLAEHRIELPPPPHLTYTQWKAARENDPPSR